MIPWIQLLFYMAVIFAPDEAFQISFDIENRTHTFNKQENGNIWYPIDDKSQEWTVEKDTLKTNVQGRKTPFYFPINKELARKAFEMSNTYEIDKGFTLTGEASGLLVTFDLGISVETYHIKWKIKEL